MLRDSVQIVLEGSKIVHVLKKIELENIIPEINSFYKDRISI